MVLSGRSGGSEKENSKKCLLNLDFWRAVCYPNECPPVNALPEKYAQGVGGALRNADCCSDLRFFNFICSGIEVVITGLTRNRVGHIST